MSHWLVFPTADPAKGKACAEKWIAKGYEPLVMVDQGVKLRIKGGLVVEWRDAKFPGYYKVINDLCHAALERGASVVTAIGDDMDPPTQGAEYVEKEYLSRWPQGEGVLQATGDNSGIDSSGRNAASRICGSPTLGRSWIELAYEGSGPFFGTYSSYYADEDLKEVSEKLGLLWQRPDISHVHHHWSWGMAPMMPYHERAQLNWETDRELFFRRKALGFPVSGLKICSPNS